MLAAALLSAATLTLVEGPVAPLERSPQALVVADFDGDGRDDVLVDGGRGLELVRGGRHGFERRRPALALPHAAYQLVADDFDGDGKLDVAARLVQDVIIARGDGRGRFTVQQRFPPVDLWGLRTFRGALYLHFRDRVEIRGRGGSFPLPLDAELAVGDLDRDGHGDLAWRARGRPEVATALARGDGYVAGPTAAVCTSGLGLGIQDGLLISTCREHAFRACDAELRCAPPVDRPVADGGLDLGDFDGDGRIDVAVGDLLQGWWEDEFDTGERVLVFRGLGGTAFAAPVQAPADLPSWTAAGDFDGNGRDDLAVYGQIGQRLASVLSAPTRWREAPARSRTHVRARRVRIEAASGHARVRIACSRGRGSCRGLLTLDRPGWTNGRPSRQTRLAFEVPRGQRRTFELPLASSATGRVSLSVHDRVSTTEHHVRLIGPTRSQRRASCLRGRVLARDAGGTVLRLRDRLAGCRFREGRHHSLGYEAQGPAAISGHLVAFGAVWCIADGGCDKRVTIGRPGSLERTSAPADPQPACREQLCADGVRRVVLSRAGAAAWITCTAGYRTVHPCRRPGDAVAVVRFDSRGMEVLARGPELRDLRLSRDGTQVVWRDGDRVRTASLAGAAQGAIGSAIG